MKKVIKITITGCAALILLLTPLAAQEVEETTLQAPVFEMYDPLIPQLFAFDKEHDIFAGINKVDNKIVIVRRQGADSLYVSHGFLVDRTLGRHDEVFIYRPKSVAIYEGHVVFLASQRDSCYLGVLDLNGQLVKKLTFLGSAIAFSYSPAAKELYIIGENATGFDVIALNTVRGIENLELRDAAELHYQKPRMSEEIAVRDPVGIAMAVIAMSVVFIALILLYITFKQVGIQLIALQNRRSRRHRKIASKEEAVADTDVSGDVYAAIAAAIHLYSGELHDEENAVLTINKVSRTYSPWSSKIHGLNTYFNKR